MYGELMYWLSICIELFFLDENGALFRVNACIKCWFWQHFSQVLPLYWVEGASLSRTTAPGMAGAGGSDLWPHVPSGFVYDDAPWESALPHQRDPRAATCRNLRSRYIYSQVKFICIALFTEHIVSQQLFIKLYSIVAFSKYECDSNTVYNL